MYLHPRVDLTHLVPGYLPLPHHHPHPIETAKRENSISPRFPELAQPWIRLPFWRLYWRTTLGLRNVLSQKAVPKKFGYQKFTRHYTAYCGAFCGAERGTSSCPQFKILAQMYLPLGLPLETSGCRSGPKC
jgi:hypothetical protein